MGILGTSLLPDDEAGQSFCQKGWLGWPTAHSSDISTKSRSSHGWRMKLREAKELA